MKKIISIIVCLTLFITFAFALVSCDVSDASENKTVVRAEVKEISACHWSSSTRIIIVYQDGEGTRYVENTSLSNYEKNPIITGDVVDLPIWSKGDGTEAGAYYN